MQLRWLLTPALAILVAAAPAPAHAHGDVDDSDPVAMRMAFFKKSVEFAELLRRPSAVTPVWHLAGQKVSAAGALADLVRTNLRYWHGGLREECGNCVPADPEIWLREAEPLIAKTFLGEKLGKRVLDAFEHISLSAADLGAWMGLAPAVNSVVFELAESIVALLKWGGAHLFCHVFYAANIFFVRPMTTAVHAAAWAPGVEESRPGTMLRMAILSSAVRRADRKVQFVKNQGFELSDEELAEVDREGPNRFWGWFGTNGKRSKFARMLERKGAAFVDGRSYRGQPMKRYGFFLRRRRGHRGYLSGKTHADRATNHNIVWAIGLMENVANRVYKPSVEPTAAELASLADKYTRPGDDVREGIAARYGRGDANRTRVMSEILREVEVVFNPAVPRRIRYFQAKKIEAILGGYLRENLLGTMHEAGEVYTGDGQSFLQRFTAILRRDVLHVRSGRFTSYIVGIGDFMRIAASSRNGEALVSKKFETMDSVRRILETFQAAGAFASTKTVAEVEAVESDLYRRYKTLLAFRPWATKKTKFSWIPFRRPRPTCHEMNQAVAL